MHCAWQLLPLLPLPAAEEIPADSAQSADGGSNELYVYNWGEYIDESVIEQFEEETGISVIYDLFETNEEMYPIIEAGAINYDVVCPSD